MKEILRRILIVLWLAAIVGFAYNIVHRGLLDIETWQISALFLIPVWVLQFILTGIFNPITLIRKESNEY